MIAALSFATTIAALYRLSSRPPTALAAPAVQAFIDFPNAWLVNPILSPDGRYLSLYAFAGGAKMDGRSSFAVWQTERRHGWRAPSTPASGMVA